MAQLTGDVDGKLSPCRVLRNNAEESFRRLAVEKGWLPCKRGWPDFICEKDGKIILVEIKDHRRRVLKREQLRVLQLLSAYGVPCYRWSPETGFVPIREEQPLTTVVDFPARDNQNAGEIKIL